MYCFQRLGVKVSKQASVVRGGRLRGGRQVQNPRAAECRRTGRQQDATVWIILRTVASRWTASWGTGAGRSHQHFIVGSFLGRRRMGSRLPFCISLCLSETLSEDSSRKKNTSTESLRLRLPRKPRDLGPLPWVSHTWSSDAYLSLTQLHIKFLPQRVTCSQKRKCKG